MVCRKCGAQINPGDMFCEKCGAKVELIQDDFAENEQATVIGETALDETVIGETALDETVVGENALDETVAEEPVKAETVKEEPAVAEPVKAEKTAGREGLSIPRPTGDDLASQNQVLKQIWPEWTLIEKLGEGSFGKVFKAERTEMGTKFYSAVKIITMPKTTSEVETVRSEIGLDDQSTTAYFKGLVDECVNEIKMMESFKGTQNIVSVEDYKVVSHSDSVGWTIFIRMELLEAFTSYAKTNPLTEKDIIKLGIDICNALEFCAKLNVMHRDIKPENIFVSKFGDYKLGDFGIARKLEGTTSGMSKKGTYNYMAPEIYSGKGKYDYKSDIYSLGIVLYKLLNNNRFPLVDINAKTVTYQQMQDAFDKRMAGTALPKPVNAGDSLAEVVLTACAFRAAERFATATAMKAALQNVLNGTADRVQTTPPRTAPAHPVQPQVSYDDSALTRTVAPARNASAAKPVSQPEQKPEKKEKKEKEKVSKGKKGLIITIVILVAILGAGGFIAYKYFTGADYKIMKALEASDYEEAVEIYNEDVNGDASKALISSLKTRLEKAKTDFSEKTIEYEAANMEVATIEKMNISEISSDLEKVKKFISELNTSRTAFSTAETLFEKEDYVGAIENYKKVIEDDSDYETAKKNLVTATDKYREKELKAAADYVDKDSYSKAIAELEAALKVLPEDSKITEQIDIYTKEQADQTKQAALDSAKKSADSGDYASAIKTLQAALANAPDDVDISTDLKDYSKSYVNGVIAAADESTGAKNYSAAIKSLEEALTVLPDNDTLSAKLEAVKASQPALLTSLTPINGGWTWNEGIPTDPFEVTYTNVNNFVIFGKGEHYAEYRLYGKYKSLTGDLVAHGDIREDGNAQIKIYADEELIYTSPSIGRKTDKLSFSADVTDADYIKIVVNCDDGDSNYRSHNTLIMMNMQLWSD